MKKIIEIVLVSVFALISTTTHAGLINVKGIVITSAAPTYLQVSEVVATQTVTHNDLALASAGATASGSGNYSPTSSPSKAIDGVAPAAYPSIFHSDGSGSTEFLNIVLAGVGSELDSITLYGRTDCCSDRDVYNVSLYDAANNVLFGGQNYSANNSLHKVTISLPDTSTNVPEPVSLALLGIGLLGMGVSRRNNRGVTASH